MSNAMHYDDSLDGFTDVGFLIEFQSRERYFIYDSTLTAWILLQYIYICSSLIRIAPFNVLLFNSLS